MFPFEFLPVRDTGNNGSFSAATEYKLVFVDLLSFVREECFGVIRKLTSADCVTQ